VNRVRFSGRLHGRPLATGRYSIAVVVVRGGSTKRIGKIGVEVVPPGSRVARSSSPVEAPCAASSEGPPLPAVVIGTAPPAEKGGVAKVGVAGVSTTRSTPESTAGPGVLRPPDIVALGGSHINVTWAIVAVIAGLLLGIGLYAVRHLRGGLRA
jgi:hypothetical protein